MLAANDEFDAELGHYMKASLVRRAIAAALTVLMDDEPVYVPHSMYVPHSVARDHGFVRPSEVLDAILSREETP